MEKLSRIVSIFTILIISCSIIGLTIYKVLNDHYEKVLLVESKYIIESAKKCVNEKVCTSDKITLKTLYDNNYLELQVNGVTKEYYNEESYVYIEDDIYTFIAL